MKNETARRKIEALDYYLQNHTNDYGEESHTAMMMAIDALSGSKNSNKWIPVSKRLPEEEVEVLIYTADKEINKAYRRIKPWTEDCMEWLVFETLGYSYTYKDDKVVAWMPLPEPYKESEDKE